MVDNGCGYKIRGAGPWIEMRQGEGIDHDITASAASVITSKRRCKKNCPKE